MIEVTTQPATGSPYGITELLRELVAHLRQNRTQLRKDWAGRTTEAKSLTAMSKEEIFAELTTVYDNDMETLESGTFETALESLSCRVENRTGLRISMQTFHGKRLPARIEVALYRFIQEALNNFTKDSDATSAKIRLHKSGKNVMCSVSDDGIGFDTNSVYAVHARPVLGLLGIQERLWALQGEFRVESLSGHGTRLKIKVPQER